MPADPPVLRKPAFLCDRCGQPIAPPAAWVYDDATRRLTHQTCPSAVIRWRRAPPGPIPADAILATEGLLTLLAVGLWLGLEGVLALGAWASGRPGRRGLPAGPSGA